MKTYKILSIGNSFSEDAQTYLYRIAAESGIAIKTVNLFIGGCPLSLHYRNMLSECPAYEFQFNGMNTGLRISLKEALLLDDWDVVTLQQVSHDAPFRDTWQPYLSELSAYVRRCQPKAAQWIHETWAYEAGSKRLTEELHFDEPENMLAAIADCCRLAQRDIDAAGIIPCGEAMFEGARAFGRIHRDTFHADLTVGRFLLSCTWIAALLGVDPTTLRVPRLDGEADPSVLRRAAEIAKSVAFRGN